MPRQTNKQVAQQAVDRVRSLVVDGASQQDRDSAAQTARAAIDACRPQDRQPLLNALSVALAAAQASTELQIASYHDVEGVDPLLDEAVEKTRKAVDLGLEAADQARVLAEILLEARLKMRNKAGLPDIIAERKFTKDIARDLFVRAREGVTEEDVHRWATHKSLAKAVRNRMSDVVVEHLRSLDSDRATFERLYPEAKEAFPRLSPTEAVYALYEKHGTNLPRKGRTELAREDARRRAEIVAAAMRGELPAADPEDEVSAEEELKRDLEALERVERSFITTTKRAEKLDPDQRAALKARINEMIANLAVQAAAL